MAKNVVKIMLILFIAITILNSFAVITCADTIVDNPDYYTSGGENPDRTIFRVGGQIVGIIRIVGSVISIGALVVMGIMYMIGSPDSKAEYKNHMTQYLVGTLLLFATSHVIGFLYDVSIR